MKKTIFLLALIFAAAYSSGFSVNYDQGNNDPVLSPTARVHIMQAGNCGVGQENVKVTFRDLTTNTILSEIRTGPDGYASSSATPGHLIGVYAVHNTGTTCSKMIQNENGIDFGYLCLSNTICPEE